MTKKLTKNKILAAIKDSAGILSSIAERLGCSRQALYNWLDLHKDSEIVDAIKHEEEKVMDMAESKIIQAIKERDMQTTRWYANTKGKSRGYAPKQEIEHTGQIIGNVNIKIEPFKEEKNENKADKSGEGSPGQA